MLELPLFNNGGDDPMRGEPSDSESFCLHQAGTASGFVFGETTRRVARFFCMSKR